MNGYGERYQRWWGENHHGNGWVQRWGNSTTGSVLAALVFAEDCLCSRKHCLATSLISGSNHVRLAAWRLTFDCSYQPHLRPELPGLVARFALTWLRVIPPACTLQPSKQAITRYT